MSIIPVAEFDFDTLLDSSPRVRYTFIALVGGVCLCMGVFMSTFFPYFIGAPMILVGASIFLHECQACYPAALRASLTTKLSLFIISVYVPVVDLHYLIAWYPFALCRTLLAPKLWSDWSIVLSNNASVVTPVFASAGSVFALSALFCLLRLTQATPAGKGWSTGVLYTTLYSVLISTGIAGSIITLASLFSGIQIIRPGIAAPTLVNCVAILLPLVFTLVIGQRTTFSLLARYFEFDLERLMEDGAHMADLAASSKIIDTKNNIRWIKRECQAVFLSAHPQHGINDIKRDFWALGSIVHNEKSEDGSAVMHVLIKMDDDTSPAWRARYEGTAICIEPTQAPPAVQHSAGSYGSWLETNFNEATIVQKDAVLRTVTVRCTLKGQASMPVSLEQWASSNLRYLKWASFDKNLLLTSPRLVSSDEEKGRLFASASKRVVKKSSDKIDFFVSHSWEDDARSKCAALVEYMEGAQRATGRHPDLWLDKVCIDQRSPENALAVLPININFCHKLLILLGDTYLQRLWCVWELFSLFTFCLPELAAERIVLVPFGRGSTAGLSAFNIDHAHCFDPNEEFKLRQIIHDIGLERLVDSLRVFHKGFKDSQSRARA